MDEDLHAVGPRLRELRRGAGLSLRDAGMRAGVAPGYLSSVERGKCSPTLATLHRIVTALGCDLGRLFSGREAPSGACGGVFRREHMHTVADAGRRYTFLLPGDPTIPLGMQDEYLFAGDTEPEYETLECDIAGVILSGVLELEAAGRERAVLRPGDAFHVPAGIRHRGRSLGTDPVRLVTATSPPRY